MFEIMVEDTFASAHQLIGYNGPCENIHGHTWKVQVFMSGGKLGPAGMLFDFKSARSALKQVLDGFDHANLNGLKYFKDTNPTAENIARIIYGLFSAKIAEGPGAAGINVTKVTVWESEKTCATYSL